ncbi:hypothetical protein BH24ACT5_BH24ACT5_17370 [soil metagenome]
MLYKADFQDTREAESVNVPTIVPTFQHCANKLQYPTPLAPDDR